MKRHIPGLHGDSSQLQGILEGVFLVRVDRVFYRWHPAATVLRSAALDSRTKRTSEIVLSTVVSTALPKRFGNSAGSCATLAMTPI